MALDFSETVKALNEASAFELFRLRSAIDRVLDQPHWMDAIRSRLRIGQTIEYFDIRMNGMCKGLILELRRKQALVRDPDTQQLWIISYTAINVDHVDVQIREQPQQGLGRQEVSVGEVVGFLDREQRQRSGRIMRLNDKTVTLDCGGEKWRVDYAYLHRVMDSTFIEGELNSDSNPLAIR